MLQISPEPIDITGHVRLLYARGTRLVDPGSIKVNIIEELYKGNNIIFTPHCDGMPVPTDLVARSRSQRLQQLAVKASTNRNQGGTFLDGAVDVESIIPCDSLSGLFKVLTHNDPKANEVAELFLKTYERIQLTNDGASASGCAKRKALQKHNSGNADSTSLENRLFTKLKKVVSAFGTFGQREVSLGAILPLIHSLDALAVNKGDSLPNHLRTMTFRWYPFNQPSANDTSSWPEFIFPRRRNS